MDQNCADWINEVDHLCIQYDGKLNLRLYSTFFRLQIIISCYIKNCEKHRQSNLFHPSHTLYFVICPRELRQKYIPPSTFFISDCAAINSL